MFVLTQSPTFAWTVKFELPGKDGRAEKHSFGVEFKRLSQARIKEIRDLILKGELHDADLVKEVLVGWKDVRDENGDVPFSIPALERMLDITGVGAAIVFAFFDTIELAKRKNS
jgi:hypothetical protein